MTAQTQRFGPTRRGGPVFRWLGGPLALDLANTVMVVRHGEEVDLLATPADLERWLDAERSHLGDCGFALTHLPEIHGARDAIRSVLATTVADRAAPDWAVRLLNELSAAAPVAPQLERLDRELRLEEKTVGSDALACMLGTLAQSAISLVTGSDRGRLQVCRAPSCGMFFVGARRWCCAACGNRARAARHYRRHHGSRASTGKSPRR